MRTGRDFTTWLKRSFAVAGIGLAVAACGGGGGGSAPVVTMLSLLAGSTGSAGSADGAGAAASFSGPAGVAVDGAGNAYVADGNNHTVRKIAPGGVVTTLAGSGAVGSADGAGAAATFNFPRGVAIDSAGTLYVADTFNHTVRKITAAGVASTFAGTALASGSADGTGAAASFDLPYGVALDSAGTVYVTDGNNNTVRKITAAGVVSTFAGDAIGGPGSADGAGAAARFDAPAGIALDAAGNVYVADGGNHTVRKINPAGVVSTFAGSAGSAGAADGTGAAARFNGPTGVAVDGTGTVYVADNGNHTVRRISPGGVVTTLAGQATVAGFTLGLLPGVLTSPVGVAVSGSTLFFTQGQGVFRITPLP